ncbi:DUF2269 family protein [Methyloceanibacter sp.]|uniref:DUF2269 family protein n=1 Tax=Methyloceanibacter sp. TaxID=1965321 RepID=UPI00351B4B74
MAYLILKYLHIIGASVLLGTGAGIAFFMLLAHRTGDSRAIAGVARIVVIADYRLTASTVALQPITGAALVWLVGYSFLEGWILLSLLLYAELFWLPVVRIQTRMRDLAMASVKHASAIAGRISPSFRRWFAFGFPAFASVLAIFWLMIARPRISIL